MRTHFVGVGATACRIVDGLSTHAGSWRCFADGVGVVRSGEGGHSTAISTVEVTRRELSDFASGLDHRELLDDASYFERLRARDGTAVANAIVPSATPRPEGVVLVVDFTTRLGAVLTGPLLAELTADEIPVYLVALSDRQLSDVPPEVRESAAATIGVDIDHWGQQEENSVEPDGKLAEVVVPRLAATFCHVAPTEHPQRVIDAADVHRVLGTGGDIVSIGYAEEHLGEDTAGPLGLDLFSSDPEYDVGRLSRAVQTVTRKALHGTGTLPTETQDCRRCLYVIGGPTEWLLQGPIADSRAELTATLDAELVLGGDVPLGGAEHLFAAVIRAGVEVSQ